MIIIVKIVSIIKVLNKQNQNKHLYHVPFKAKIRLIFQDKWGSNQQDTPMGENMNINILHPLLKETNHRVEHNYEFNKKAHNNKYKFINAYNHQWG